MQFDGPIPGENYTSDTKNYPWHRPPEFDDYDKAVEYSFEALMDPEVGFNFMAILEAGYSIATATDIFVTQGIGDGKWTPDFAILLAGPVARILQIMAKSYNIDAELGAERPVQVINPEYLAALNPAYTPAEETPVEEEPAAEPAPIPTGGLGGLMAAPAIAPKDEQMDMLGYGGEDAAPEEVM